MIMVNNYKIKKLADLHGADLRGADLRYADVSFANLVGADLRNANSHNANLRSADLTSADLSNADLSNADLRGADLTSANLRGANLRGAHLQGADLTGAELQNCTGNGKEIKNVECWCYSVAYTNTVLSIGCKQYTKTEWLQFTDCEISDMDDGVTLECWTVWKPRLIDLGIL